MELENKIKCVLMDFEINEITLQEATKRILLLLGVSNRALWRIEPHFDGISTAVTTYKVVDQNGTLQYMGDRNQCEYFLLHGR